MLDRSECERTVKEKHEKEMKDLQERRVVVSGRKSKEMRTLLNVLE